MRTRDAVAAVGERLSSELAAEAFGQQGLRAETIDPRTLIVTDDAFGAASPLLEEIGPRLKLKLKPMLGTGQVPGRRRVRGRHPGRRDHDARPRAAPTRPRR